MRLLVLTVLALAVAVPATVTGQSGTAQAQSADARVRKRLTQGISLFRDLEYRRAIRTVAPIVKDPAATRAQRLRALEVIGLSHLILGEEARAREAFQDLLAIDPGYQLRDDTGSPKIRNFFDQVKREYVPGFDAEAVAELDLAAPTGATAGRRIEIDVRVARGAERVKSMRVYTRRRGVLSWPDPVEFRRQPDGRWRARFDAPASDESYALEYYVEARGVADQAVARIAGPETPLSLAVTGRVPRTTPWYRRWYTLAGGAAVVGIGTALIITSGGSAEDGSLQPGRVTLSP